MERDRMTCFDAEILASALDTGFFQISSRVTSRPMRIPRCVPLSLRGKSGQGELRRSLLMREFILGCEVVTTHDLSLLIPRPETLEKRLMRERAGYISFMFCAVS